MLQFIAQTNDKYSIPEQIQMAVEGGCSWVVLDVPEMSDEEIRELAGEIIPLCRETSTILTIVDHLELANELRVHGVQLRDSKITPVDAREILGPDAIIGVEVKIAADVVPLRNLDIDYAVFAPTMPIDRLSENVEAIRNEEIMTHLVASGDYKFKDIHDVLRTRVNGIALGKTIINAKDPVAAVQRVLTDCKKEIAPTSPAPQD